MSELMSGLAPLLENYFALDRGEKIGKKKKRCVTEYYMNSVSIFLCHARNFSCFQSTSQHHCGKACARERRGRIRDELEMSVSNNGRFCCQQWVYLPISLINYCFLQVPRRIRGITLFTHH